MIVCFYPSGMQGPYLKMYTVYGSNYQNAITTYQKEVAENKSFVAALKASDSSIGNTAVEMKGGDSR